MARGSRVSRLQSVSDDEEFWEDLSEIVEFAEGLPEKYLQCRELGHLWRPWNAMSNSDGGYDRTLRCTRCMTKREQVISRRGVVLQNKYIHPEGYLHKGMGRIVGDGRGALRLESIKRTVTKQAEKAVKKEAS